jgi:hypothetical protein
MDCQDRHWRFWCEFLAAVGVPENPFLDGWEPPNQQRLLSAFIHAVRSERFSKSSKGHGALASGTCGAALSNVATSFVANGRPDPRHDVTGKTAFLLRRQLQGYRNQDPGEKFQKCIPLVLWEKYITQPTTSPYFAALQQLTTLAFFFAMRSCEYLLIKSDAHERRTKPLRLRNLQFRKDNKVLPLESAFLRQADSVTITFEYQKR